MTSPKTPLTLLVVILIAFSCSSKKEQPTEADPSDTIHVAGNADLPTEKPTFSGEYLIGDGGPFKVVLVGDTYEVRDDNGGIFVAVKFQGKENDTLSVYTNEDKSITFKMHPGHKAGKYYAPDEEWPVSYLESAPEEVPVGDEAEKMDSVTN